MTVERQLIPEGLARMAPGLELAAALAELDITRLSGYDAVIVLQAYARLEAHVQAAKAAIMAEVGLYEVSPCDMKKMVEPDKYSADEIRAALALTRRAAEREYDFSYDLKTRLPQVRAALSTGLIDKPRAVVFRDWLQDVPDELARAVIEHLLPNAGQWTTSELKGKIKRLLVAADPQWARRRYERAVQQRRVEGVGHADGTATITGHQLPVDQAAAAIGRVDAIARRAKQTGLPAPIDHIRSDVFLGLLDGSLNGLDNDAILAVLLANAVTATGEEDDFDDQLTDDAYPDPPAGRTSAAGPASDPAGFPNTTDTTDHAEHSVELAPATDTTGHANHTVELAAATDTPSHAMHSVGLAAATDTTGHTDHSVGLAAVMDTTDGPAGLGAVGAGIAPAGFAAGELRVLVSTLMHLDDLPAELAGWGPVHASLARRVAKRQISSEWRFAICNDAGQLEFAGITRYRPAGWPPRPVAGSLRRRGIVELQIPLALLRRLHAQLAELGGWARVIGDIMCQFDQTATDHSNTDRSTPNHSAADRGTANPRGVGEDTADRGTANPRGVEGDTADRGTANPRGMEGDTAAGRMTRTTGGGRFDDADDRRRFAKVGLRRWVEIRDRVCCHPGCRAPASRSELDHTRQHALGGLTTAANLAALCAHDHDLRDHGWCLLQPTPGHLVWISRTGHRYAVRPPPIIESLPEPLIPSIPQPISEVDLPVPGSWEYDAPWSEEPQPQTASGIQNGHPTRFGHDTTPTIDAAPDVPPF